MASLRGPREAADVSERCSTIEAYHRILRCHSRTGESSLALSLLSWALSVMAAAFSFTSPLAYCPRSKQRSASSMIRRDIETAAAGNSLSFAETAGSGGSGGRDLSAAASTCSTVKCGCA